MLATVAELGGLSLPQLRRTVGSTTFERGEGYARANRVLSLDWDPDELVLTASVVGTGAVYETTAWFDEDERGGIFFVEGECSCPVGYDCKHVAAIVFAAASERGGGSAVDTRRAVARRAEAAPSPAPGPADWELPLRALAAARWPRAAGTSLAIELRLTASGYPDGGAPRLMARLMRPGARGGWVNGSLDWNGLDSWKARDGGYREGHLALIRELHAVYRLGQSSRYYYYPSSYGTDREIDLSACESPHLWPLLERAARLELPLIHTDAALGEVRVLDDAELVLDVTRAGERGLSVEVVLQVAGKPAGQIAPVRFIGREAHGLVCAERADVDAGIGPEGWRLRLVRLTRPAAPQLERMLLVGERLAIPEAAIERFGEELCPALRHIAPVISSDRSFAPLSVSEPSLVLQARYGGGTEVEVDWAWAYQVGGSSRREPLLFDEGAAGHRDPAPSARCCAPPRWPEPGSKVLGCSILSGSRSPAGRCPCAGLSSLRLDA